MICQYRLSLAALMCFTDDCLPLLILSTHALYCRENILNFNRQRQSISFSYFLLFDILSAW